ncbi:MAG: methyltransferase [bacterium]|nr:methyltransferase [bacterium]
MSRFGSVLFLSLSLATTGCQWLGGGTADGPDPVAAAIERAAADPHRSESNRARNGYRHPVETLTFFGLEPDMSVLEIRPGGGLWYTEILAPLLAADGRYIAASYDLSKPDLPAYVTRSHEALLARFEEQPERYGDLDLAVLHPPTIQLGADESVDLVLNFRNTHGLIRDGAAKDAYAAFFAVLKSGGVLGVVQHRAGPKTDTSEFNGYVPEEKVIALAESAGFVLDAKSEINANPNDSADYEGGVWTLPPTLRLGDTDREKYLAIGESDRMTLRFRKP